MAYEVYAKDSINWWKDQVGKSCGKTNEYSAYMDSYNFYNGKKNGVANSCAIFYDTGIMKTMTPEANANAAREILCEPNTDNCGAGCAQKVQYYKNAKRWVTKHSDAQSGDEIFFRRDSAVTGSNPLGVYHTGAVVDWDDKGFYTVEGNTNGGQVAQKFYPYGDSRIAGFGRPKWTGWERPKEENPEPVEDPTPEPEPQPTPEPVKPEKSIDQLAKEVIDGKWGNGKERAEKLTAAGYDYQAVQDRVNEMLGIKPTKPSNSGTPYKVVNVNSFLRIRSGPGTNYEIIGKLYNNNDVTVYETRNGWAKISENNEQWCSMDYLKKV